VRRSVGERDFIVQDLVQRPQREAAKRGPLRTGDLPSFNNLVQTEKSTCVVIMKAMIFNENFRPCVVIMKAMLFNENDWSRKFPRS
jgi:hypothetical protein